MIDTRSATIATLRARLAALGGAGPTVPARLRPTSPPATERARLLGFEQCASAAGAVHLRRVTIPLQQRLELAGLEAPGSACGMLALVGSRGPAIPPRGPGVEAGCTAAPALGVLDIETLGLRGSGVVAFLVGLAVQQGTTLEVSQFLLGDPGAEEALLAAVAGALSAHRLWLSYNGRSFDIPTLAARCTVNRLEPGSVQPALHVDLLGPVRRLFGERLSACTLRHAETSLLGFHRRDDVPGCEAPMRYHRWLRGGPPAVLSGVIDHNLEDLVSTAVLGWRLVAHAAGDRVRPEHPADGYHLARHLERRGQEQAAEAELRRTVAAGVDPWARRAGHRLAHRLHRQGQCEEATAIWRRLFDGDGRDVRAARSLAIRLERSGRLEEALQVCGRVHGLRLTAVTSADWLQRDRRLRRRLGGRGGAMFL